MSATRICTEGNAAKVDPKAARFFTRSTVAASSPAADPTDSAHRPMTPTACAALTAAKARPSCSDSPASTESASTGVYEN